MTTTKKILLIGRSGRGKSTLANVLSETNKFKESSGSVSETRKIQFEEFADKENDTIYLVIDTPGIGDTKMSDNEVLDIIAEAVYLAKDGIDQVLFVIDGRFDQYEMITYDLLRTIIFDQNITKHTTIARTRFEDFTNKNECENNLKKMIEETEKKKNDQEREIAAKKEEMEELTSENEQYQKLLTEVEKLEKELKVTNLAEIIKSCQKRIVYIDNPPIEIAGAKDLKINRNKKKRVKSQKILLAHLKNNCQNDSYKPEKLTKLSEEITEDMDNLLQSRREYEEEMKKLKTSKSSSVNNQFAKITTEGNQEPTIENDDDFAVGEKATNQPTILQLESKRSKLRREIAEKEKLIRQKVLKHIFNNYNDIASVEGSSNFIDSMIDIDSWQEIHHEFTKELVKQWLSNKFDYEKTQKWAAALKEDFDPEKDAGFCVWLRDDKQLVAEKIKRLSHPYNIEDLRKEYAKQLAQEVKVLDTHNQKLNPLNTNQEINNLQEYLNKKYPSFQDKQNAKEIVALGKGDESWLESRNLSSNITEGEAKELEGGELDLSAYPNLETVVIGGGLLKSKLTSLKLTNCSQLKILLCSRNQLTNLDISKNKLLTEIYCGKNKLTQLILPQLDNLQTLSCHTNELTNLDFLNSCNKQKLEVLGLADNNFPAQDLEIFSSFSELKELSIDGITKLSYFFGSLEPLQNLNNLELLYIRGTDINHGLEYLPDSVKDFRCEPKRSDAKVNDIYQELQPFGGDITKWRIAKNYLKKITKLNKLIAEKQLEPIKTEEVRAWKNINANFTNELIQQWQFHDFTYQQTQEWINIGLTPKDANFVAWLRDIKEIDAEELTSNNEDYENLKSLKQEFQQWLPQQQSQIEIPPK